MNILKKIVNYKAEDVFELKNWQIHPSAILEHVNEIKNSPIYRNNPKALADYINDLLTNNGYISSENQIITSIKLIMYEALKQAKEIKRFIGQIRIFQRLYSRTN